MAGDGILVRTADGEVKDKLDRLNMWASYLTVRDYVAIQVMTSEPFMRAAMDSFEGFDDSKIWGWAYRIADAMKEHIR